MDKGMKAHDKDGMKAKGKPERNGVDDDCKKSSPQVSKALGKACKMDKDMSD